MSATAQKAALLPEGFADLEVFSGWLLETEVERSQRRRDSAFEDIRRFYDAMLPRLPDALTLLNGFPLDAMPLPEHRLFLLTFSFAEIAPFVEQYARTVLPENFDERRFIPEHDARVKRRLA